MSKNKRKNVEEETIEEEEETSITNVKHPRLKSASRIASSNPSSIALPEILENENIPLNTHKTAKKNELVASFTNFVDGEKSVTKETLESSDSRKPQIDNLEKDEILASFEVLTSGEGKTREQAYKIIGDIKGKSMKTNILRWIKERDDLLRTGTPKQDGRKERRTSIDDSIISSKANNIDAADGTSSPVKKTGGIKVAPSCAHALAR